MKTESLKEIYEKARTIPESIKDTNKYTFFGYNKVIPIKYMSVNDTFEIQTSLNDFIRSSGDILLFPNIIDGEITDLFIRSIKNKSAFLTYRESDIPYGAGYINEKFKYGNPLFVVEGIGDYGALKLIYPSINVVAMMSNSIPNSMYDIYAGITNNIVLLPDNDSAGLFQVNLIRKEFKKRDVTVTVIKQFSNLKDTGDIADMILEYKKEKNDYIKNKIDLAIKYYKLKVDKLI